MATILTLCSFVVCAVLPLATGLNPIEIDLSPLPGAGAGVEYRLHLKLLGLGGGGVEQGYKIGANTAPSVAAELRGYPESDLVVNTGLTP